MNILVITQRWYPDTFGGSEHVAAEQARRLAVRGHKVTVLTERVREALPERIQEGGLTLYRYGAPEQFARLGGASRTDIKEAESLVRDLWKKGEKWDVAILHHPFPAYGFFRAGVRVPSLYVFHASTAAEAGVEGVRRALPPLVRTLAKWHFVRWASRVEAAVLNRSSRIAVLSEFSRRVLTDRYPLAAGKAAHLPVGIDTAQFHPANNRVSARALLGLTKDRPLLLTVRRFTPRMGLLELLAAMEGVLKTIVEAQLLIVGEGPLKAQLQAEIERCQLQGKVTLVGSVPLQDLPLYYQAADLFVLPTSAYEGLGMATLEALASGLPVLGTPAGATPEVLGDLDQSLIAKSISAQHIAAGILAFFARPQQKRVELGRKARELALAKYDWERAVSALEEILKTL